MSFIDPGESFDRGSGASQRGAREEALAEKRMAQRQAKDADPYDGVTERRPPLSARLKKLFKK